jgi:hypothetical protein
MKSIHKLIIALTVSAGVSVTSCQKLDIPPTNIFTPQIILGTEAGVNSLLATIYRSLPIEDFKYRPDGGEDNAGIPHPGFNPSNPWMNFYHAGAVTGEMVGPFGGMDIGAGFGYWPYANIRNVNILINDLPKYADKLGQAKVDAIIGEAHFLRAYYYFALAKRYGGVPIITIVQDPGAPISELQVHRDKEEATWDFIGAELDLGYKMMPETNQTGRANKYVAAALKSRAMLYAGCIAKYGSVNFVNGEARSLGFVGIGSDKANGYFTKAFDAAKLLEGHYSLYEKNPDKVQNYVDLFLKGDSPENIFIKQYSIATNTAHSWDATMSPRYMTANALSRAYPTLDFVQRWGALSITNADGTPKRFNDRAELMQGIEPRLLATVYFPGAVLRGLTFDMQRGVYPSFSGTAASEVAKSPGSRTYILSGDPKTLYQGKMVIGFTGLTSAADDAVTRTGFYVRKYIDYTKAISETDLYRSQQPWIDLRYAEILLNRAEADVELGNTGDALTCINQIRNRAGATPLTSVSITDVRNERCMELAFENHYYWDLKRWRIADVVLNNAKFKGLMPYYVANESKYIFLAEPELFQRNYNFDKRFYYEPIPGGELGKNPNLYPNNPNY